MVVSSQVIGEVARSVACRGSGHLVDDVDERTRCLRQLLVFTRLRLQSFLSSSAAQPQTTKRIVIWSLYERRTSATRLPRLPRGDIVISFLSAPPGVRVVSGSRKQSPLFLLGRSGLATPIVTRESACPKHRREFSATTTILCIPLSPSIFPCKSPS